MAIGHWNACVTTGSSALHRTGQRSARPILKYFQDRSWSRSIAILSDAFCLCSLSARTETNVLVQTTRRLFQPFFPRKRTIFMSPSTFAE
eukprot:scaffold1951_cov258-Pinguiococcus_pyrenoidosus.AAC.26